MYSKYEELLEACRKGHMYDFIANESYRFDKEELVEILKQTYYAIYQRMQDQAKEIEQLIPQNLDEYGFFDNNIQEPNEKCANEGYYEYLAGHYSYDTYCEICRRLNQEPRPAK